MHMYIPAIFIALAMTSSVYAEEKFEKVVSAFETSNSISRDALSGEHAWAGYCIGKDDVVSDAFFAYRSSTDPILGTSIKALELEVEGSSNFFVRMDEAAARKQTDEADPSQWQDGSFNNDELLSRVHWRFQTVLRSNIDSNTSKPYFIALRQCRSIDGKDCNGTGNRPFITYAACYYYAPKF